MSEIVLDGLAHPATVGVRTGSWSVEGAGSQQSSLLPGDWLEVKPLQRSGLGSAVFALFRDLTESLFMPKSCLYPVMPPNSPRWVQSVRRLSPLASSPGMWAACELSEVPSRCSLQTRPGPLAPGWGRQASSDFIPGAHLAPEVPQSWPPWAVVAGSQWQQDQL